MAVERNGWTEMGPAAGPSGPEPVEVDQGGLPAEMILGGHLVAWLMLAEQAPAPVRAGRTLTVWYKNGEWHASLHRRARRAVAFLAAATLEDLLLLISRGLREKGLVWRQDRP